MRRSTGPLVLLLLFSASLYAAQPVAKVQESYAPYWTSEPGWTTELQLKNNLTSTPLTVTPVLRLASGREIPLDPTTIPPNTSVSVWVNEGLLAHASDLLMQPGSYGSVVFRYTSANALNLYANVVLSIHGEPISFPILAHPEWRARTNKSGSLEGIWWQPHTDLNDIFAIGNHSDAKVSGKLSLFDATGKQWSQTLTLDPHQTQRLSTSDLVQKAGLSGTYGGISFVSSSTSAIDVVHFIYNEVSKFSASLDLFNRDPNATLRERAGQDAKHWTMRAPMLALRSPDPALGLPPGIVLQPTIFVRNTTARNITADMALSWHSDSAKGQVKLPELQLAPFVTQQVQIGPALLQNPNKIPQNAHWGMVTLTTDALPDDLVAIATSADASGRFNLSTRFAGGVGGHFVGGEWQLDANHNEIAAITNIGAKPTDALLTLHYDNGQKKYEMQQPIAPGDQMWINLAQLVRNRVADRHGNTLPADVSSVTYETQDSTPGSYSLMANTLALDGSFGFQAVPPILRCCGADGAIWNPDAFDLVLDGTEFGSISGTNQCTGLPMDISGEFTNWWSGNSAVATVATKQVHGVAAGFTDGFASGWVTEGNGSYCTVVQTQVTAPITVEQFNVAYSAYIPVDHISGPSYCYYQGQSNDLIYVRRGATVIGIDISPELVAIAGR